MVKIMEEMNESLMALTSTAVAVVEGGERSEDLLLNILISYTAIDQARSRGRYMTFSLDPTV